MFGKAGEKPAAVFYLTHRGRETIAREIQRDGVIRQRSSIFSSSSIENGKT